MKELPKLTEEDINEIVKDHYGFSVEEADEMIGNLSNKYYSLREEYQKLIKKNEKLNHYKLLYQKVKDRNDKAIERLIIKQNSHNIIASVSDVIRILKGNNE